MSKFLGFLSFGHWSAASATPTAAAAYLQSVDLAVAAEELGLDGAYFRVHHFAEQLTSPFPLLAATAMRTSRIELGTGVIDMRYENPLYMAESAGATDLIAHGRLQLGISRGAPGQAKDGPALFGYAGREGGQDREQARRKALDFLTAIEGTALADPDPQWAHRRGRVPIEPQSPGLRKRIWWGAGSRQTAVWAAHHGLHLQSSTVLLEDTGAPFDRAQAEQIRAYRDAWAKAGWSWTPRVAVTRSVVPITTAQDAALFGARPDEHESAGRIPGLAPFRSGRSYSGAPERIAEALRADEAIQSADTILLTVPAQLGVDYTAHLLESIVRDVAPALGWR